MEVILLENVKNVGQRFTRKQVSDGYARNFLLPKGLAEIATEARLKSLKSKINSAKEAEKIAVEEYAKLTEELQGKQFELHAKANEEGGLYASVDTEQVAGLLQEKGHTAITKEQVDLASPIKTTGAHAVILKLDTEHTATVTVNIVNTDHE